VVHPEQPPDKGDGSPTGEDAVLDSIGRRLKSRFGEAPPGETWTGDDAAVVLGPGDKAGPGLLLSTDAMVAGVHFDLSFVTLADVGWKAISVAISDIAAMGGVPAHALVALCAEPATDFDAIVDGVAEAAERWQCPVVGGDLSSAAQLVISVAVTGTLGGPAPAVYRSGARPRDALFVTGPLGAAAAGLRLLSSQAAALPGLAIADRASLERAFLRPEIRLAEGRAARDCGASAMMDLSDGLGLDLHRLARASGVGFVLDEVPVAVGATLVEALGGGEDYELLIAASDDGQLEAGFEALGLLPPHRIGVCTSDATEHRFGDETLSTTGYQHRF
jgi:thiamine-monophosphate kinase